MKARPPLIRFHGAARTVTGSCTEIMFEGRRILVDCGLFQGSRSLEQLNFAPFAFDPASIDAVILTHAHIDHSGLLPRLVRDGFKGPIWATEPTAQLLDHMLPDSARLQESDARNRNRRADRADEPPIEPLYRTADANRALRSLDIQPMDHWFTATKGIRARLWNAGHVLGSTSVEIEAGGVRIFMSGDLGPGHKAFHPDPEGPSGVDYLICESTYGDTDRAPCTMAQRRDLLEAEVKDALARGGNLLIPVFALERTQEILLDLAALLNAGRIPRAMVFIDSPLANKLTSVFSRHSGSLEDTDGINPFTHTAFRYVGDAGASRRLSRMTGSIILAGSGMCEGGRIRHHLHDQLPDHRTTLLFVGYQAEGTLGRVLRDGARRVRISGRDVAVRATIRSLDCFSAHADREELIDWIRRRGPVSGSLFLNHGEPDTQRAFVEAIESAGKGMPGSIIVPAIGEAFELAAGAPAKRVEGPRTDLPDVTGRDWQNDYADLAVRLKKELAAIADEARRREAIAEMGALLRRYQSSRDDQAAARKAAKGDRKRDEGDRRPARRGSKAR